VIKMEIIERVLEKDRFCMETVGIELLEVAPGRAKTKLPIGDRHLNGLGIVQGGALFTLADFALAAASNSHGTAAVLVNANITYFKGLSQGTLFAEAAEEFINSKLATYTIRVTNEENELIALMQATVYRKKESLESLIND
jgi:acyl-CoA thioesterase